MIDPFDPVNMAARHLFNAGQVEAQANRIEQLEEKVRRLTKAGDAMSSILIGRITSHEIGHAIDQWDAAKEGKPTL